MCTKTIMRKPELRLLDETSHAMKFVAIRRHLSVVGVSFPKQCRLTFSCKSEGPAANQNYHLFYLWVQTLHEISQASIFSICKSFIDNVLRKLSLQALQMHKTDVRHLAMKRGQIFAHVYARKMNNATLPTQLVEIHPSRIKTAEIINHRHLKFKWKICLQEETLKTLHGIRGRVCF